MCALSVQEILEHAERLEEDLRLKRRQIAADRHTPAEHRTLLRQIDAMTARVKQIENVCAGRQPTDMVFPVGRAS